MKFNNFDLFLPFCEFLELSSAHVCLVESINDNQICDPMQVNHQADVVILGNRDLDNQKMYLGKIKMISRNPE